MLLHLQQLCQLGNPTIGKVQYRGSINLVLYRYYQHRAPVCATFGCRFLTDSPGRPPPSITKRTPPRYCGTEFDCVATANTVAGTPDGTVSLLMLIFFMMVMVMLMKMVMMDTIIRKMLLIKSYQVCTSMKPFMIGVHSDGVRCHRLYRH